MVNILILDEEAANGHRIKKTLDRSYVVFTAQDCDSAMSTVHGQPIDLVFVTLSFPHKDLLRMLAFLRDHSPDTRIIALSRPVIDKSQISALIQISSMGVNRVLKHPLADEEVSDAVDQELRSAVSMV